MVAEAGNSISLVGSLSASLIEKLPPELDNVAVVPVRDIVCSSLVMDPSTSVKELTNGLPVVPFPDSPTPVTTVCVPQLSAPAPAFCATQAVPFQVNTWLVVAEAGNSISLVGSLSASFTPSCNVDKSTGCPVPFS